MTDNTSSPTYAPQAQPTESATQAAYTSQEAQNRPRLRGGGGKTKAICAGLCCLACYKCCCDSDSEDEKD